MFDSELLRTFTVVADLRGFTSAAERLNMTQSTVSFQIKRLEEQVGRKLLERTTRKVTLTPEGEVLLGYAHGILSLHEAARLHLAAAGTMDGAIRLGTSEDFASGGLARALSMFRRINPRVRLEVEVGISRNLIRALDSGKLDLVLGKRAAGDRRGELLWREPVVWAYARGDELDANVPLPVAFFPEPCVFRDAAVHALCARGRSFEIVYVSASFAGLKAAASAGLAAAPLPASILSSDLRVLTGEDHVPALPEGEFVLFSRQDENPAPAVKELAGVLSRVRIHA